MVTDSHQEDDDGAKGHHRGDQEEAESVHRASDPAPFILLLEARDCWLRCEQAQTRESTDVPSEIGLTEG